MSDTADAGAAGRELPTYHVVHDRHRNPGRYMAARETSEVRYWDEDKREWVIYPEGTLYPSRQAAQKVVRRLERSR